MSDEANDKTIPVLVTVADEADVASVADALRLKGVEIFDVLELSGVITAQVADKDWTTIQNTPGVASVEEDQTFTAI